MRHLKILTLVAFIVGYACAVPALAVIPANPGPPTSSYQAGSIHVDEYGTSGKPALIFIPGLTCGPWEWYGEIAKFAPEYRIYALTLPGFDGQPALKSTDLFGAVSADFWKFLREKQIAKPVLIGHSLGGTLAIDLAEQHSSRLRGVIAVDGLPIYPGFDSMPPAQRRAIAVHMSNPMTNMTPAQFATSLSTFVASLVTSPSDAAAITALAKKSDPAATAEWLREDVSNDLRPSLNKITVPLLEIAPFDATIDARYGATSAASVATYYESLLKNAPTAKVVTIAPSRHFIMYDQPQALDRDIAAFLAKN